MTDIRPLDIHYGQVGDPTYDTESRAWHFQRRIASGPRLEPLGQINFAFQSPWDQPYSEAHYYSAPSNASRKLADDYPTLVAIPGFAAAVSRHNDSVSSSLPDRKAARANLFVRSEATVRTRSKRVESASILAAAAGQYGDLVRLTLLKQQQLGWGLSRGFGLRHATAKDGETGWWDADGEPIEQICSGIDPNGETPGVLAVRYSSGVSILQPVLQQEQRSPHQSMRRTSVLPSSRLHANEIIKLGWRQAGRVPFADVAFGPWDAQRFATIDQQGTWIIWSIKMQNRERGLWIVERGNSGCLLKPTSASASPGLDEDGWARIIWACNSETLAVANRTSIALFVLSGSEMKTLELTKMVFGHTDGRIRDLQRRFHHSQQILLLTSSKILILKLGKKHDDSRGGRPQLIVSVALSWVHYRSPLDASLHLSITETMSSQDNTLVYVLLCSRTKGPSSVYTLEYSALHDRFSSIVDPYLFPMICEGAIGPASEVKPRLESSLQNIELRPLAFGSPSRVSVSDQGLQYMEAGYKFYQVSLLFQDLSFAEGLYALPPPEYPIDLETPYVIKRIEPPKTPGKLRENFLVPDDLCHLQSFQPLSRKFPDPDSLRDNKELDGVDPRTLPFEWLLQHSTEIAAGGDPDRPLMVMPVDTAIAKIESTLADAVMPHGSVVLTLFELIEDKLSIDDIVDAETKLDALIERFVPPANSALTPESVQEHGGSFIKHLFPSSPHETAALPRMSSLGSIHEWLLKYFLAPHALRLPNQARRKSEGDIDNIAVQMYIASHLVLPPKTSGHSAEEVLYGDTRPHQQHSTFDLPVRERASTPTSTSHQSTRIGRPATSFASSEAGRSSSPAPSISSHIHKLSSYTTHAPQTPLPGKFSMFLDTWTIGTGDLPNTNDLAITTQRLLATNDETEDEVAGSSQTRKANKRRKRLRETVENWSADRPLRDRNLGGGSQPLPLRTVGSQDVAQSSQMAETQGSDVPLASTQPEPGPHGRRPEKRKGKQKRRAGF